jgi:hypothetical protein
MAGTFKTERTIWLKLASGDVIRISPQGGRVVAIRAPDSVKFTDRHGNPLTKRPQGA